MKKNTSLTLLLALVSIFYCSPSASGQRSPIRVLIVDGQNNHDQWPKVTAMMKYFLEDTKKFKVDVQRSHYTWKGDEWLSAYPSGNRVETVALAKPKADSSFRPKFSDYDVIVSNFGWNAAPWPLETQKDFERYMQKGGGLVVIHAANNSFPEWIAYNQMIGLGGWGNRTEKDGPYVYYDQEGKLVRDNEPGNAGSHGAQSEFLITVREPQHPITKGMPSHWLHSKDELYDRLRGPAENMQILATAFSPKSNKGTDRNEPMLMTLKYGKGRVFHMAMGHVDYSVSCVGFITCLQRGSQWAATGKVDIPIPTDFPTENKVSQRSFDHK
ncbi:ThuA domain-containing protein [Dyadobacter tibetensis]|uniref:ThuA domain-containing protein n=1 Tax=Dyadobacter tibetensis TaxID=1211851 RepID=UPI00046F2B32|nr:ThuA domain-containing protein [Dyadobacter tibetensis]